jgi:hypothetical protein
MVWVDQDMFKIMDGPDWDRGNTAILAKKVKLRHVTPFTSAGGTL